MPTRKESAYTRQQNVVDRITTALLKEIKGSKSELLTLSSIGGNLVKTAIGNRSTCKYCDPGAELVVRHVVPAVKKYSSNPAMQKKLYELVLKSVMKRIYLLMHRKLDADVCAEPST